MEYIGYVLSALIVLVVLCPMVLVMGKKAERAVQMQTVNQDRVQDLTRQIENVRQENAALLAKQDMLV